MAEPREVTADELCAQPYSNDWWLAPGASERFAYGLFGVAFLVEIAVLLLRFRKQLADAARTVELEGVTEDGSSVIQGTVVTEDGKPAITVEVVQSGREYQTRNGRRHVWTEFERSVSARPIVVRDARGQNIRVEPDDRVFLIEYEKKVVDQGSRGLPDPDGQ